MAYKIPWSTLPQSNSLQITNRKREVHHPGEFFPRLSAQGVQRGPGLYRSHIEKATRTPRIGQTQPPANSEAPENLFQDYGSGSLVNGNAHISLDPIFSKNIVVNSNHPLRVFIQLEGDCNGVYVTNKTANGFDVKELAGGSSSIPFTWTVVANRADLILEDGSISPFSQERFAPAQGPLPIQIASESTAPNVKNVVLDEDK